MYFSFKAKFVNQLNLHIIFIRNFVSYSFLFVIKFAFFLSCFKNERPFNENSENYENLLFFWQQQQQQNILNQIKLSGDDSLMLKKNMTIIVSRDWFVTDNCLFNNHRLRKTRSFGANTLTKTMDGDRRKTCRYWRESDIKSRIRREHFTCLIS